MEAVAPAVLPPNPALAGPAHGPRPVNRPQRDFAPGFLAANQAVRQTGMPGLQPDQPASPGPAISGALNRAPPPAVSAARETARQPQPPTLDLAAVIDPEEYDALLRETAHGQPQPPTLDLAAVIAAEEYDALLRETAHGQPQPPTLDLAAMIDPEEYDALLRDCALSDRPPDPVVIRVDPRLLHDE